MGQHVEEVSRLCLNWFGRTSGSADLARPLSSSPLGLSCVHWHCPKPVACFGGPFNPCETERCVLIGRYILP
jgi:hypothetical protein